MRRSLGLLLVLVLVAGCDREGDQRARCARFAETAAQVSPSWVETCVKERWSQKQMECHARAGGGFAAALCDD